MQILHIVPDNRLGGIYTYIARISNYKKKKIKHYIFNGQPKLKDLNYFGIKPFNFRKYFSFLIIFDLIINTPLYVFYLFRSNKVFFHSPFFIFHHLLAILLGKKSYLLLHDFNILYPIKIIFIFSNPKNIYCASEVLIRKFKFLKNAKVLNPYYSDYDLFKLKENKTFNFEKKSNIFFLGNINKVKKIKEFSVLFENIIKNNNLNLRLDIFGEIIDFESYKNIKNLNKNIVRINKAIKHSQVNSILKKYKFIVIPSESEVFPIVYYEALKANVIPIVNDIDFFRLTSSSLHCHFFNIKSSHTLNSTIRWAEQLNEFEKIKYIKILKFEFIEYYKRQTKYLENILEF